MEDEHFMTDNGIISRIIASAVPLKTETILEIGAGKGALTAELAQHAGKVIAIEKKKELFLFLKGKFHKKNIEFLHGNALTLLPPLRFDKIVSNIPYSICEPLFRLLPSLSFREAYLTIPFGFSEKLFHPPYSLLFQTIILFPIPKEAFSPRPRTQSVFVRVVPKEGFFRDAFLQRKSKVKNALKEALIKRKKMTKKQAKEALKNVELNIFAEKRIVDLSAKEFTQLEKILRSPIFK